MIERMPIMGSVIIDHIPFAMLVPHERQAMFNHGQTLDRLAERGGLSVGEATAIIEGRSYGTLKASIDDDRALINLVRVWRANR